MLCWLSFIALSCLKLFDCFVPINDTPYDKHFFVVKYLGAKSSAKYWLKYGQNWTFGKKHWLMGNFYSSNKIET